MNVGSAQLPSFFFFFFGWGVDSHIPRQWRKLNKNLRLDHRNQKTKEASSRAWASLRDSEEAVRVELS